MKIRTTVLLLSIVASQLAAAPPPAKLAPEEIRLTVHPAAPPVPAMRYHFLPDVVDQTPGNAALLYLTAAQQMAAVRAANPNADDDSIDQWLTVPIAELPKDQVQALLNKYSAALNQFRLASLREHCDFDTSFRTEGFRTILPYLNDVRPLARLAALSARLKMANGDFDGAVKDMALPMIQGQHLNNQALLVQLMVAGAVSELALRQVQDLIAQENAPNLYWALGDLPVPLLSVRNAMKMERAGAYFSIPQLKDARAGKLTAEQWRHAVRTMGEIRGITGGPSSANGPEQIMVALMAVKEYPIAKQYLLDTNLPPGQVEKLEAAQVLGLYHVAQFERWTQELDKCLTLPFWQGMAVMNHAEDQIRQATQANTWSLIAAFAPSMRTVYTNLARTDRRVALWRTVEAVRAYAAAHDAAPPARLEDITQTPAPLDPMTGNPFVYQVRGNEVTLEAPAIESAAPSRTGLRIVMKIVK